jgi:VWFA-related protein
MAWMLALSFGVLHLALAGSSAAGPQAGQQQVEPEPLGRTVYVTVTDKVGSSVPDLKPADFAVKIGGKDREVLNVEPATAPLRIAVIVDDNGTGFFRYGVGKFIERLHGNAEFSISEVTGQTQKIVDYTGDGRELSEAIARLGQRPATSDGGQLLEGIAETARDFTVKGRPRRSIILALTVGGEEHSTLPADHVLDELRRSGAALHVVQVSSSAMRSTVAIQKPSALLGENMNLSEVLGEGPKRSGGTRDEIVAAAGLVSGLQHLAQSLLRNQYAVTYSQRQGEKTSDKINVSVKVPGITVQAPTRIPDK